MVTAHISEKLDICLIDDLNHLVNILPCSR